MNSKSPSLVFDRSGIRLFCQDVFAGLSRLPLGRYHAAFYSPPYYGMVDYHQPGQHGMERSVDDFLDTQVNVIRGLQDLLIPGGIIAIVIGDGSNNASTLRDVDGNWTERKPVEPDLLEGELLNVPFLLAEAARSPSCAYLGYLVWDKGRPVRQTTRITNLRHEVVLFFASHAQSPKNKRRLHTPYLNRFKSSLLCHPPETQVKHRCAYPISLATEILSAIAPIGSGRIIAPYSGSGSTELAALDLGMQCDGIDLDCSEAIERITRQLDPIGQQGNLLQLLEANS